LSARTSVLVGNLIATAASVLIGAGVLHAPAPIGVALAFYTVFIVPGLAGGNLLLGPGGTPLEGVCRAFFGGAVFASAVICIGFIPGISYGGISLAAAILSMILAAVDARRSWSGGEGATADAGSTPVDTSSRGRRLRGALVAVVLVAICFAFFYGSGELGWGTDGPDHVSYVRRSLDSGALFPKDSFYRDGDGVSFDIRKGLWQPVLSLWSYRAHAAPEVLWRLLPAFVAPFALAAFLFLGTELLGSPGYAALGLVFMLLFYGGEGLLWLTKVGFGRNAMHILFWGASAYLLRYCRAGGLRHLAAVALLSAAGCAFHVVFALLIAVVFAGVLLYSLLSRDGARWRGRLAGSALAAGAGVAVPLLARARFFGAALNEIHTHRQGMLVFSPHLAMVDPVEILVRMGVIFFFAVLALPFFLVVAPRPRRALVFTLTIVPMLLVLNPLLGPPLERHLGYLHYRMLEAAPLMFFAALMTGGLVRLAVRGGGRRGAGAARRVGALIGLVLFLYVPVRAALPVFATNARSIVHRNAAIPARFARLLEALEETIPSHAVIASDPVTSYALSAYTDYFVVATLDQHGSPADTTALERLRCVRDLLSPGVPLAQSIRDLRRWGADYVLLNADIPAGADFFGTMRPEYLALTAKKLQSCPRILREVLERDGFVLFAVEEDPTAAPRDSCVGVAAPALECDSRAERLVGTDAGCGVMLESIAMESETLAAGETLRGSFCWRTQQPIRFGLPLELTIRIDGGFPKGRWYRQWYGKQYRRIVERRRQAFYRETWSVPLASGSRMPDQWSAGTAVREPFALAISPWMAPGRYDLRVKVWRRAYLPNRTVSDYLSNEDSLEGSVAASIVVQARRAGRISPRGSESGAGGGE